LLGYVNGIYNLGLPHTCEGLPAVLLGMFVFKSPALSCKSEAAERCGG